MNTHTQINQLWERLREAIDQTYAAGQNSTRSEAACLRDYAQKISWSDDLAKLLGRETANERQHRSNRPAPRGFSVGDAARLILMDNVVAGAKLDKMPEATLFLTCRQTAAEAIVIGYLIRNYLPASWQVDVVGLDYVQLMKEAA